MEYIVLGLLLLSDRTIYGLRDRVGKGLHLMYSSSMGSIQAAVRKMLRHGYIQYTELMEQGKHKKLYSITESGKAYFQEWVNRPMSQENVKNPELAKIYFMGFADKETRRRNMEQYLEDLRIRYRALTAICEEGERMAAVSEKAQEKPIPEEGREIFAYQLATAYYGRDFLQFQLAWYEKLLLEMQRKDESL